MPTEMISFTGVAGGQLSGVISTPEGSAVGCALLAHCFTCSKEIHTITRLSSALVTAGWATMAFDFTGLGRSEGDLGDTNVSTELGDITRAAVALIERGLGPCLLVGHSLGGAAAVLAAGRVHTLNGLVAIASPSDVRHVKHLFGPDGEESIRAQGCATVDIGGRPFPVGVSFLDDLERHDVVKAARSLEIPFLVVEAGADQVVDRSQTRRLAEASPHSQLVEIPGADHLFTQKDHARQLADAVVDWLAQPRSSGRP